MSQRHNQRRVKGVHRCVADIARHIEHGTHREIHLVLADHRQSVPARHVAQLHVDAGIAFAKSRHQLGHDVYDGGFAGRDHHLAGFKVAPNFFFKAFTQRIHALDQGPGHIQELEAIGRKLDTWSAAFEQHGFKFVFKRLDLEAHGRLAEKQLIGRIGHLAVAGHGTKCPELLQRVAFVVVPACHLYSIQQVKYLTNLIIGIETFNLSKLKCTLYAL